MVNSFRGDDVPEFIKGREFLDWLCSFILRELYLYSVSEDLRSVLQDLIPEVIVNQKMSYTHESSAQQLWSCECLY